MWQVAIGESSNGHQIPACCAADAEDAVSDAADSVKSGADDAKKGIKAQPVDGAQRPSSDAAFPVFNSAHAAFSNAAVCGTLELTLTESHSHKQSVIAEQSRS